MQFERDDTYYNSGAIIKVIGVGDGGCNAVHHMLLSNIEDVDFICVNTDAQALNSLSHQASPLTLLPIGTTLTKGLCADANPELGRQAATADREMIMQTIAGADMLFIIAGMGGNTGTSAAPVIAQIARDMGILTVAVVTKPFHFEDSNRMKIAQIGCHELTQFVDALITIPTKLLTVLDSEIAFTTANNLLLSAVRAISDLILRPKLICIDFADVRTTIAGMGLSMMGTGNSAGENRAHLAAEAAVTNLLLNDINLRAARGVLVNIKANASLTIGEFTDVGDVIRDYAADTATIVIGTVIDHSMGNEMLVTVFAMGVSTPPN